MAFSLGAHGEIPMGPNDISSGYEQVTLLPVCEGACDIESGGGKISKSNAD